MEEKDIKKDIPEVKKKISTPPKAVAHKAVSHKGGSEDKRDRSSQSRRTRRFARTRGGAGGKRDFDKKVLEIRRVTRVVAGGRRFSFSATVVVGDKNGKIGLGVGKGNDTAIAIDKATNQAKKNMVTIVLTKDKSIAYDISAKYCASRVELRPSSGIVAGGAVRTVADLVGIRNINAKILSRSKNHINNARAAILALQQLK